MKKLRPGEGFAVGDLATVRVMKCQAGRVQLSISAHPNVKVTQLEPLAAAKGRV